MNDLERAAHRFCEKVEKLIGRKEYVYASKGVWGYPEWLITIADKKSGLISTCFLFKQRPYAINEDLQSICMELPEAAGETVKTYVVYWGGECVKRDESGSFLVDTTFIYSIESFSYVELEEVLLRSRKNQRKLFEGLLSKNLGLKSYRNRSEPFAEQRA